MRLYRVSTDVSEKEKVIGGLLTLVQGVWLGVGMALFLLISFSLGQIIPPVLAIILGLIVGGAVGGSFAFLKIRRMPLLEYIRLKVAFRSKTKYLINTLNYKKEV